MFDRNVVIDGVNNARQLGGFTGAEGKKIKLNSLIRCGRLTQITPKGIEQLYELGVKKIIDLRSDAEVKKNPEPSFDGIENVQIRIVDENQSNAGAATKMMASFQNEYEGLVRAFEQGFEIESMYIDFMRNAYSMNGMATAIREILDTPEGAVIFHCNGGKDRTGTLAIFVEELLGVEMQDAMDDFELTNISFAEKIKETLDQGKRYTNDPVILEKLPGIAGVNSKYMDAAMDEIKAEYGSLMGYIKNGIGITDEEIAALRARYLE